MKGAVIMGIPKQYMVEEIKKRKDKNGYYYTHCYTKTGRTKLEDAPEANVFCMYNRICLTGTRKQVASVS